MTKDEFNKLFKYMDKRFGELDHKIDKVAFDVSDISGTVAELVAQIRCYSLGDDHANP